CKPKQVHANAVSRPAMLAMCALAAVGAPGVFGLSADAKADTLPQALVSAYRKNPTLAADRARQRATDEEIARARSGWRPTVTARGQVAQTDRETKPKDLIAGRHDRSHGYSVELNQPVFRGFQTLNGERAAEATVSAGQSRLLSTEQQVLLRAVDAYVSVVRDQAIVSHRSRHQALLSRILRGTSVRLRANEVTATDFAQARSRRAAAVAAFNLAKANLQSSRASYLEVIGNIAGGLRQPPPHTSHVPHSAQEAGDIAAQGAPAVTEAQFAAQAAQHTADRIRGELLPQVDVRARYAQDYGAGEFRSRDDDLTVSAHLTVPILTNGDIEARVRQARHQFVRQQHLAEQASNAARTRAMAAWAQYTAARAAVASDLQRVDAARKALFGVREEENAGQRTVLDVLNAHEELLLAQIQLAADRRNHVLASYNVLAAIGKLTMETLGLTAHIHDPSLHLEDIRHRWMGVEISYDDGRHEFLSAPDIVE
ncbi:MAG: TolC family outer membrane protein, partial [Pseudomonadota bacterium]